ncbi:MAG: T9SS type A sorting domain-containing protein, partial [Bacteroidales bacterium]|nr:T9SS type A sorting domain-containing protein [Bacteroidales bacterium]
ANDFQLSDMLTGYAALELNDVTEVGFWITSRRDSWGHALTFTKFLACDKPSLYGDHTELKSLISECHNLVEELINNSGIGDGHAQYPEEAKNIFQTAIKSAQETDNNDQAKQTDLDAAVFALNEAKEIFIASENVVDYTSLATVIKTSEELYNSTESGTDTGQYPEQVRTVFREAIESAKAVYALPHLTTAEVDRAVTDLTAAMELYKNSCYTAIAGGSLLPITLYPNPVKDVLYVETEDGIPVSIEILSANGALMKKNKHTRQVDLSSIPNGFYIVRIVTNKENRVYNILKE